MENLLNLNEVARRERRSLLAVSFLSMVIVCTGLMPKKINALGIELTITDQKILLGFIALLIVYFLIIFLSHSLPTYFKFKRSYKEKKKII